MGVCVLSVLIQLCYHYHHHTIKEKNLKKKHGDHEMAKKTNEQLYTCMSMCD